MQLNKKHKQKQVQSVRSKLALATCSLLQVTSQSAQAGEDQWKIDADLLIYSESDSRVSLVEPVVNMERDIGEDDSIKIRIITDTITGSTPNGALPSNTVQTFTNPSGNSGYTIAAGNIALNSTFRDKRTAVSVDYTQALSRLSRVTWGLNVNKEYDYSAFGGSATYQQEFNNRNSTLMVGLGTSSDKWFPVGDVNTEFAPMINFTSTTPQPKNGNETKTTTDFMVGWTQVINRSTLMQFNLGMSNSSGYLTDPYKIISVVDTNGNLDTTGFAAGALPYLYEKRPDSRSRKTFYWKTVHHLTEDVINASYRYFTDDWGVKSHALDFHYRYELDGGSYFQPHLRYYSQTAADFYQHSVLNPTTTGTALPEYASNDYRLGEFTTTTMGVKYAMPLGKDSEFSMRLELMNQTYNTVGTLYGQQNTLELTPDLSATIIQFGYSFYW